MRRRIDNRGRTARTGGARPAVLCREPGDPLPRMHRERLCASPRRCLTRIVDISALTEDAPMFDFRVALMFSTLFIIAFSTEAAPADESPPPIEEFGTRPNAKVFADAKRGTPLVLQSQEEASKYFDEEALASLAKEVDFERQFVLVFAWRGSGGDKLIASVAESFPEQVRFRIEPGRSRDLRRHAKVIALRKNVKWSVAE